MKIRTGFVSNSSTASFVVKTRPTYFDKVFSRCVDGDGGEKREHELFVLSSEKIELLKKMGFVPTKHESPFRVELNYPEYDKKGLKTETIDDTLLKFSIVCNHRDVLEFLVANDIPFRAAAHYGDLLYSYEAGSDYVYIIRNFGMEYARKPNQLEEDMKERERIIEEEKDLSEEEQSYVNDFSPFKKISKKEFLQRYDEEESIREMTGEYND